MHYSNASILESVAADKQNPSLVCIAEHTYSVHLQPNAVCSFHSFSVQISILFSYLLHAYIYIPPSSLISLLYSAPYVYTPRIALLNGPLATALHLLRKCSATDVCPLQDMDSIPIQSSVIYWSRSFHHFTKLLAGQGTTMFCLPSGFLLYSFRVCYIDCLFLFDKVKISEFIGLICYCRTIG